MPISSFSDQAVSSGTSLLDLNIGTKEELQSVLPSSLYDSIKTFPDLLNFDLMLIVLYARWLIPVAIHMPRVCLRESKVYPTTFTSERVLTPPMVWWGRLDVTIPQRSWLF